MKGLTSLRGLAKGMKGLKAGLKGFKSARTALTKGAKGAFNRLKGKIKGCGDPVDAATGQMFLEEIDVTLPGTLPLVFTRRVASGYRTGGWFGPSWTSTIDQRLEIDQQGIVFVTEDGMLLDYPHPTGPDAPVLPESGPRWPLERLDDGAYSITDPVTGHRRRFAPPVDGEALLARISDRNHNAIDIDYDAAGVPLGIRHCGGYHLKLTVEDERVIVLSLAGAGEGGVDAVIKQYGYTDGNLTDVTNSSGLPLKFTYDEQLRITSWEDTNQSCYGYVYDEHDRCIAQGGTAGHVANTFTYDVRDPAWPDCLVTEIATSEGATTRVVIDENCLVVAEIDPLGGTVTTAYDSYQHVAARTDQLGHTTTLVNNELGQPVEVIQPDGAVVRVAYNELNLPTVIELPDGTSLRHSYDARGNCTSTIDPAGAVTFSTFTTTGQPATFTNELGHTTSVRWNPAGLPLDAVDPMSHATAWRWDAWGRPVGLTDATGHTMRLMWSTEGRLLSRISADGTTESWTYDGEGNCTSYTDQLGQVSRTEYTHFDLVAARTTADGARHEFAYDASLKLTQVTNPLGLTWNYGYDIAGRRISETDFDERTITYTHDAAGRLTSCTNALGQTIAYKHDAVGRLIRKEAAEAVTTYGYDLVGRLMHATGPDCDIVLVRDQCGRVLSETTDGRTVTYGFDETGRRISRTTPTGATSTRSYDAADQLTRLTASGRVIDFDRDLTGREVVRRFGAHIALAQGFDELGRLISQTVTAEERSIQHRTYTYRADGNLLGMDDQLSGPRGYDLDMADRVTAVHGNDWTETYAYDGAGNQTEAHWPSLHPGHEATGTRHYAGTRVTRAGQVRYEHDELGRVTLRQKPRLSRKPDTWRYSWDAEDRLTSVTTPDGTRWLYRYDPLGRRVAKQRFAPDGETVVEQTVFTWDGTILCEQTTIADELPALVTLTWEHQGLTPILQTESISATEAPQEEIDSRFFSIITDLVGSPSELIDENGEIAWRARSSLWGTTAWAARSITYTPLRFPGQYFDPETELHYNYFRHYDPETGRYASPDPLGLEPAPNPVAYVNNPHMWVDPHGLTPCRPWVTGKGDDPLVPELADEIHARYPGHMKAQGVDIVGADGKPLTDFDIVTGNAVIQVKDGSGKGALKQALNTQSLTDYPVIVYLPKGRGSVIKSLEEAGIMVTRDKETLMQVIAP
ncbi:DUF6531 domain-containing protein [Streptomyces longisporoflavus]|uniref:DUF6531 domain-containing protein n=1 Tax=Streptomyces longisporoflavus TaxID=28044 RepID=UPI00167DA1FB|nr:DUF6531 domain-containing protein [Streptomyces longisporoflavus]